MRRRAILLAWMMAAQVVVPSFALLATVRTCCCSGGHTERKCHCPSCSKARAIEEGQDFARSCGSDDAPATLAPVLAMTAPVTTVIVAPATAARITSAQPTAPPWRAIEVATPPPLA